METWLIVTLGAIGIFIVSLFFEEARDFYEELWEYAQDILLYLISFEWISDVGEVFSNGWEAITNLEDSPILNPWFWVFYACLLAGVWYLPGAFGVADYSFIEKIVYTLIFFVVDWFIIAHFQNS